MAPKHVESPKNKSEEEIRQQDYRGLKHQEARKRLEDVNKKLQKLKKNALESTESWKKNIATGKKIAALKGPMHFFKRAGLMNWS